MAEHKSQRRVFEATKRDILAKLLSPAEFDRSKVRSPVPTMRRHISPLKHNMQKGGVDIPVADLVEFLNAHPDYVTTSSCSGRIAITSENPGYLKQARPPL